MAQRVLGIDLGTFAIKVAEAEVGFRTAKLLGLHTCPVPQGPAPALERCLEAFRGMNLNRSGTEVVAVGFPGDRVLLRLLDIPFAEPKKVGAVVGNELADDIPWELEDVVYDYTPLVTPAGKVLAAAARASEIKDLLDRLAEQEIDPRSLTVAPLAYASLVRYLAPEGTVLVADLGHQRANFCLVQDGRALVARTASHAGQQITEAFRQALQLSFQEAEQVKEQRAMLVSEEELGRLDPQQRQLATFTAQAVSGLIREMRMTAGIFTSRLGLAPERVLLCGGTSLIRGLDSHISAELGLPTERIDLGVVPEFAEAELTPTGEAVAALSLGVALEQGGRRGIDLRQGEFAFRTDRSVFTEKLVFMAVSLVVVLVFGALNAYMSLYALRKEEKVLRTQLKRTSKAVLGEVVTNGRVATRRVKRGCQAKAFGVPRRTAFDILDFLSREIPGADKVKLDLTKLDIKPGKTFLKGTADTRSAIGDIAKALEKNPCFSKVTTGKISGVSEGKKQFTLTINTECF